MEENNNELKHYGIKGMKWGVRKDPSAAYRKSSRKADRLNKKVNKSDKKLGKHTAKLEKAQRRYAGWGLTSNKALLRETKRVAHYSRQYGKRIKKQDRWLDAMEKNFANVKMSEISERDLEIGRNYLKFLIDDM